MIIAELHKVLKEAARGIFVGLNQDPHESLRVELQSMLTLKMSKMKRLSKR